MSVKVVIIDYGMGNLFSVKNALDTVSKTESLISSDPSIISSATHLVLPGVGAFGRGMANLKKGGLVEILNQEVIENRKPILGLCLGMQMFAQVGEEDGENPGLGWIAGRVKKLSVQKMNLRLPHIGWNDVEARADSILFKNVNNPVFYFVHSYHFAPENKNIVAGETDYGKRFVSSVEQGNIFGVQFHPEKSQKSGLQLLDNFLSIDAGHA